VSTTMIDPASEHMPASTHERRERKQAVHLGTFADGQRAVPVTVTYSAEVGSFGGVSRD
jgi:hypothetical protein